MQGAGLDRGRLAARPRRLGRWRPALSPMAALGVTGQASTDRMSAAWPTAVLVHLPVHASWLNQVEVVSPLSSGR
jgi:hypothetical protein